MSLKEPATKGDVLELAGGIMVMLSIAEMGLPFLSAIFGFGCVVVVALVGDGGIRVERDKETPDNWGP